MLNVTHHDYQLAVQNNGHAWIDCNDRGRPHRWGKVSHRRELYWHHCSRCGARDGQRHLEGCLGVA